MFDLRVAGDGQLDGLSARVDTGYGRTRSEIADSISARFGPPARVTQYGAEWTSPDVRIEMLCGPGEWCKISFSSKRAADEAAREAVARKQRDAKRPVSP